MNSNALAIVGKADKALPEILAFIDTQTKGQGGEDYEILDTFPVLFICGESKESADESLKPYISEELTFVNGRNEAGQSFVEILELLDATDVYVGGSDDCPEVQKVCRELNDFGLNVHML